MYLNKDVFLYIKKLLVNTHTHKSINYLLNCFMNWIWKKKSTSLKIGKKVFLKKKCIYIRYIYSLIIIDLKKIVL